MVRRPVLGGHQIPLYSLPLKPRLPCCALSTRQFFLRQRVYHGSGWKTWHGPHLWQIISCKWTLIWLMSTGGYHESISLTQKVFQHTRKASRWQVFWSVFLHVRCLSDPLPLQQPPPRGSWSKASPMCSWASIKVALFVKIGSEISHLSRKLQVLSGQQWNSIAIGWKICNIWNMYIYR